MKKHLFICLSIAAALSGCSNNEEMHRSSYKALSFETFVGKGTRAVSKESFAEEDNFGVFAYRHTEVWADGIAKTAFMENVQVSKTGGAWVYSPIQEWAEHLKHTFLAYSPHNGDYKISEAGVIAGIRTSAQASLQTDLLYVLTEAGGNKDLTWKTGQNVVLTFRHALSQIRISASTDKDYSAYYSAVIRKVELTGIADKGDLNLAATTAETSPWSSVGNTTTAGGTDGGDTPGSEAAYTVATGELNISLTTTETLLNDGVNLFMQIPQAIDVNSAAKVRITYDVTATEAGNVSNAGMDKTIEMPLPAITWEHNHIYHYKVKMNLEQLLKLKPVVLDDPAVVEWENGGEISLPVELTVTLPGSGGEGEGSGEQTATGNATLSVTKSNAAGETQAVQITNPAKSEEWIVEVGPEITDASADGTVSVTRTGETKQPASWLKVCMQGEETDDSKLVSKLTGTDDAAILIKVTEENTTVQDRKAEVTIRRVSSGVTRIVVTQAKASDATITPLSLQFPAEGGEKELTVTNPANATWTLSKSDGADWLTLQDASGQVVVSGTSDQVVKVVTTTSTATDARTATITLSRAGQEDVNVTVNQEAGALPQPLTVSPTYSDVFTYLGNQKFTVTITNPGYARPGYRWTLEGLPDWLTVDKTQGTDVETETLTFTISVNTSSSVRSSTGLTIKREGQDPVEIIIFQYGSGEVTFSGVPVTESNNYIIDLPKTGGSYQFKVDAPAGVPWEFTLNNMAWATITPTSGTGSTTVTVYAPPTSESLHAGNITLHKTGQANTAPKITISQGLTSN